MRALLLSLTLILAVGCQCSETDGEPGPNGERRTIAVIPKGTTHVFWRSVHAGALAAGRDRGVEILWQGPVREDDRSAQIRVVEDMISRGVDAIVLAPLDDTALVPVATEASREGIPVVIFDSGIEWDGRVSFVATDNYQGGVLAAERMNELLGGQGRVMVMRYQEGSDSTARREAGFLETMTERFTGIEVVSSNQYGGATTETAYATAENLLVSHPDVDGVFTPNESTTFGMLRALTDADRAGEVKHVGFDASESLVAALREGHLHGLVLQNPVRMGDLAVRAAVDRLDGRDVEARIDTGATMVTRENMDEPDVAALLTPDLSILDD
ncbi:MAG: substrate-binding domain-containing protein [Sandaracinaceae bacterium]|nr:substrate-binding domain-containing protein [Sandaracinaceae bacterium]